MKRAPAAPVPLSADGAGRRHGGAYPDLGPSEDRYANISAYSKEVPFGGHLTAVGAAVSRIVEMSAAGVLRVDFHETTADPQSAERALAQFRIGIAYVSDRVISRWQLRDFEA